MSRIILLDSGPLGMLARQRPLPALKAWTRERLGSGSRLAIPEIADYEVRRELLLARLQASLNVLNALQIELDYLPVTTAILRQAAQLWAEVRQQGSPTADRHALDGDVILAATARALVENGHDAIIATTNVGHLSRFSPAQRWQEIT
jgi:predicted nucleic acid-binding protein